MSQTGGSIVKHNGFISKFNMYNTVQQTFCGEETFPFLKYILKVQLEYR